MAVNIEMCTSIHPTLLPTHKPHPPTLIPVLISESKVGKLSRIDASFCLVSVRSAAVPPVADCGGCCCWLPLPLPPFRNPPIEYACRWAAPPPLPPGDGTADADAAAIPAPVAPKGRDVAIAELGRRCCALVGVGTGPAPPAPAPLLLGLKEDEEGGGGGGKPVVCFVYCGGLDGGLGWYGRGLPIPHTSCRCATDNASST